MSTHPPANVSAIPVPSAPSTMPMGSGHNVTSGSSKANISESTIKALIEQGFTRGLAQSLTENSHSLPLRIWVVDNSGSMQHTDGHRMVPGKVKGTIREVDATRWEEIKETVQYHVQLSGLLEVPTSFRLLNDPGSQLSQQFDIAQMGTEQISNEIQNAMNIMAKARPCGVTPLTFHVQQIRDVVAGMKHQLLAEGKRVAIILATDGLPSDSRGNSSDYERSQFINSLRDLETLPVWVVIRLCTDDESVVDFYNGLDDQLELSMDVLDAFYDEAKELYEHNKWINYILPLHRLREMGYADRVFDLLDERTLTRGEMRSFCSLIFGMDNFDGVSDPTIDWKGFLKDIKVLLDKEKHHWNPIKKKMTPLLDLKEMNNLYGDKKGCSIM